MEKPVCIKKLDKAEVLKALWDAAKIVLSYFYKPMSLSDIKREMKKVMRIRFGYFDYLSGKCLKVDLNKDDFF